MFVVLLMLASIFNIFFFSLSLGALIEYAVILNQKQKAAHPRKKKEIERKKLEQQEIIKTRNGSFRMVNTELSLSY
jgi:predicted membrane protein